MKTARYADNIPYIRTLPIIYGKENLVGADTLLSMAQVHNDTFIAREFVGKIVFNDDNTVGLLPEDSVGEWDSLRSDSEEYGGFSSVEDASVNALSVEKIYVPLMRPGFDIYGHWLLDILPKLSLFMKLNPRIPYEVLVDERCKQWSLDLIAELFGSGVTVTKIKQGSIYQGVFFLTTSIRKHDYISGNCRLSLERPTPKKNGRKLYISRRNLNISYRELVNWREIEKLFESYGFDLVHPQEMSIKDQIELFSQAEVLAGEAGSGLHNCVFSPEGVKIINIQSGRQNHFIQSSMSQWYGQETHTIYCRTELDDWNSNFIADEKDCEHAISAILGA